MADRVWKGVDPKVLGRSQQLLLNKFFDPSTPSMRKGRDGENGKKSTFIVATNVVASLPPKRRSTGTLHARANCEKVG